MIENTITYEQPLNEAIRICLRLEHLFQQLHHHLHATTSGTSHIAILALLKALNVIDRPDLKTKLTQILTQQASALTQLKHSSRVDSHKLQDLLTTLNQHIDQLHHTSGKFGESLRQNVFLNQIRSHLHSPAGPCHFTSPAYALWLRQPSEKRMVDLQRWANEFKSLHAVVNTILQTMRKCTTPQEVVAQQGFYQQTLNASSPCQLIQLTLSIERNIYPEICAGKHRLVIRFFSLEGNTKISDDVSFTLNCCRV